METRADSAGFRGARIWHWLERHSGWLLALMMVLYAVVFTLAAIRKFQLFRMGFDVALIHQSVWNTTQGRFLETHAYDFTNSLLGTDSFLMAAWLAPLYALFPSVYTLFAAVIAIVALGALPLYLLARDHLGRVPGLIIAAVYFLYTSVEYGSLYEIRFRMIAMAWLAFLLLFIERERYWAMLPFLFLALSCRLDTTVAVVMVGLYALLRRKPWYYGLTLVAAGVGWYLVMTQVIIPALGTGGYIFAQHYEPLGSSPGELLRTAVTQPLLYVQVIFQSRKMWYLFQMGAPLLFLPLWSWPALLPLIPLFLFNLLSNRSVQWDIYHHYQGTLTPLLMMGTILAWERFSRRERRPWPTWWHGLGERGRIGALGLVLLLASVFCNLAFRNPLPSIVLGKPPARTAAALGLIARIPAESPVAASNLLAPHIPVRRDIFLIPGGDFHYAERPEERAEYILLDLESERGAEEAALMAELLAGSEWRVEAEREGYVLLARQP